MKTNWAKGHISTWLPITGTTNELQQLVGYQVGAATLFF